MDGVTSSVQAQLDGKAASKHTHNYAGSASAGGAANSANIVNITRPAKSILEVAGDMAIFTEAIYFFGGDGLTYGAPVNYVIINAKKGANHRTILDCYALQTGDHYINGCLIAQTGNTASNANVWTGWVLQPNQAALDEKVNYSSDNIITIFGGTNQISISTDTNGQIYNSVGYKNGVRWTSSGGGETPADNMGITGFIPIKSNDILRFANVSVVTNSYVIYFDANKQVLDTDRNFDPPDAYGVYTKTLTHTSAAFIRLTLGIMNNSTIATINEEIVVSGEFNTGWLSTSDGKQFAPKTFITNVFDREGKPY
jgi:hypothetical protein